MNSTKILISSTSQIRRKRNRITADIRINKHILAKAEERLGHIPNISTEKDWYELHILINQLI